MQQNLEGLAAAMVLDRNSQVWFHKYMVTGQVIKIIYARPVA